MTMLLLDFIADDLLERYTNFISTLTWYQMYCAGNIGAGKQDYIDGFNDLDKAYEHLWDLDEQMPPEFLLKPITNLFASIQIILNSKEFTDEQVVKIASLIKKFQNKNGDTFRKDYVRAQVHEELKFNYSTELYKAVVHLLRNDNTDEAISTAFKFLDNHLQKLLGLTPYQYHGESLINYAFSPKTGVLQLNTDPNEQLGLRNFFSGANAVFRNPTAHRFIKYDLFFASSVVSMVNAMSNMATEIAKKKKREDHAG